MNDRDADPVHRRVAPLVRGLLVALVAAVCACAVSGPALGSALFLIDGAGWGNGVGMSQWGAEGYALHGWGYERILAHYYPDTSLASVGDEPIRVLLLEGQARVRIDSAAPYVLADAKGRKVHVPARTTILTTALRVGRLHLTAPVEVRAGAQPLSVDGRAYRGSLTLEPAGGKLSVVNTVPLERYLRGVVPSEMPDGWQLQAYEVQAIAARSYALASLTPGSQFDVYADNRSQVYGGIAAEEPETNEAVADTAGKAVSYDGRVIKAYYDSSSGGRTAAVQDVFPGLSPEPYLVSVADPFDTISPYHRWRVTLTAEELGQRLGVAAIADAEVLHDGSGIASSVVLDGGQADRTLTGAEFAGDLGLRSARFSLGVVSLAQPGRARAGTPLHLRGFVRHAGGVVLQQELANGAWRQVARIRPAPDGRFDAVVRPRTSTSYRLAVDGTAGPAVAVSVRGG